MFGILYDTIIIVKERRLGEILKCLGSISDAGFGVDSKFCISQYNVSCQF